MLPKITAILCGAMIAMSSSFAVAQDLRFGQPFDGVTVKAGLSLKFGETRPKERGPQFRFAIEAGSEQVNSVMGYDRSYRSAPLTGLTWDFDQRFSMNMGGMTAYQYEYGEATVMPALYADGKYGDTPGRSCDAVCITLIVVGVAALAVGLYYALDDDDGRIVKRTSGNDKNVVNIHINDD